MTLEEYILNPMGKSNAVLNAAARESIRQMYKIKFDNILLRENGRIEYQLYEDSKKNTYWIYAKIPSESVANFYYDVVFKFYANQDIKDAGKNLFKYNIQFYSNDPAFVYTYAYVFAHKKLFINELIPKMSKTALKTAAKQKNPTKDIGYVKIIYFAYLLMVNRKLNLINKFKSEAKPFDFVYLFSQIMDADQKIAERQDAGNKISKKKKRTVDKRLAQNVKRITGEKGLGNLQVRTTKRVGTIKNKASGIKFVKRTKRR